MPTAKWAKKKRDTNKPAARKRPTVPKKMLAPKKDGRGRPTGYRKEYDELAFRLCLMGAIDAELAEAFDVSQTTIDTWKKKHASFSVALRAGKARADGEVAEALYNKAIGYVTKEEHLVNHRGRSQVITTSKQLPPDTQAIKFWLKNRQPTLWRESIAPTDVQGGAFGIHIFECLRPEDL